MWANNCSSICTSCALTFLVASLLLIPRIDTFCVLAFHSVHSAAITRSRRTAAVHSATETRLFDSKIVLQMSAITTEDDNSSIHQTRTTSKRKRILNLFGLHKLRLRKGPRTTSSDLTGEDTLNVGPFDVTTLQELDDYFEDVNLRFRKRKRNNASDNTVQNSRTLIDYDALLASLSVKGDTQIIGSAEHKDLVHPVVQLLHERRRKIETIKKESEKTESQNSKSTYRTMPPDDGFRIALSVEGGGMRGCVTAGMVTAIHYLGLQDTIDVVYGSSAGTVIGAYFITRQLPHYGPEVYYDALTTAGDDFINTKRFLRAIGLGFLDPRLTVDVVFRRNHGKPVLDLSYLLRTTMQENKPLDWETFEEMQKVQPLKVMASGLRSERAIIMDMERGSFRNIEELAACMQASCLLPGVAGPVMNMKTNAANETTPVMIPRNNKGGDGEPLADSLLFEPMPYRAALTENATHVIVLRSRPDGVDVTGKTSLFEKMIIRRFFLRKNSLRNIYDYMRKALHKKRYAEDVIVLNEAAHDMSRPYSDTEKPHLLPIAVPPGSAEVTRLETGREPILQGVRRGFARAYDALVEDPEQRGKGVEMSMIMFPDEILDYDPEKYTTKHESAYTTYLEAMKNNETEKHSSTIN